MAMNQDQDRADQLAKRLGAPPTEEVLNAVTGKTPKRETEQKRDERRLGDKVDRTRSRQRGDQI